MQRITLRPDGLQLDEDRRFQERFWRAERIAWAGFALIVAMALAGVTGAGGPLSSNTRQIGDAYAEYPRVTRWATPDTLKLHFSGPGPGDVVFGPRFVAAFRVDNIVPEPTRSAVGKDGLHLTFEIGSETAAPVSLQITAQDVGYVSYDVTLDGAGPERLGTLILP